MPNLSKIREMHIKTQETVSVPIGKYLKHINQELARVWENKKHALLGSV